MEELNTMLAELADDGSLDSSGVFTVSLDKAEEKLAAYRLANPGLFVLNLVAAAVCLQAAQFDVETRENRTSFAFEAPLDLEEEQLARLFTVILEPAAPAYLRELGLAVHSARALPGEPTIYLMVSTARICRELVIAKNRHEVLPAPPAACGVTLTLEYPEQGGWSRLFSRQNKDRRAQLVQNLFHFCRYAPLEIRDNGRAQGARITLGVYDQAVFAWRHLQGRQPLKVATAERRFDLLISAKQQSPVESSIVIALINVEESRGSEGLLLVSRGVVFRRPASCLGFPLAQAVVSADHLEKNLSQSDLVEGEDYEALLAAVRAEIEELILEVCSNPPPGWSSTTSNAFARAISQRYPSEPAPIQVETFRRLRNLGDRCTDLRGQEMQMEFWRDLRRREPKASEEFRRELGSQLKIQLRQNLAARSWQMAAHCRRFLGELQNLPADALLAALLEISGESQAARGILDPALEGYTPALAYLLDWTPDIEEESPIATFLRFQKAVEQSDLVAADRLAADLAQNDASILLQVWLGWYALFRDRPTETYQLWDKAVSRMKSKEWTFWSKRLWQRLQGRVSFLAQVRWGAKRAFEETFTAGKTEYGQMRADDSLLWAFDYWSAHRDADDVKARYVYVSGILSRQIDMDKLALRPLRGRASALGFFA